MSGKVYGRAAQVQRSVVMRYKAARFDRLLIYSSLSSQIPDEVTDYYLQRSGFETDDVRVYVADRILPLSCLLLTRCMTTESVC
jgi:hypothetical protein